jgi:predicted ArsR family transcriptional regulator
VTRTIPEIAQVLDLPKEAAVGLVKFLGALGLASFRGERPSPTGRGKGAHVYQIAEGAGAAVADMIRKLE